MKYKTTLFFILFFLFLQKGYSSSVQENASLVKTNASGIEHFFKPFKTWDAIQIEYISKTNYAVRHQKFVPGLQYSKSIHTYIQNGHSWSYTLSTSSNLGGDHRYDAWSDGKVSKFMHHDNKALIIREDDGSNKVIAWDNPLFECFSFLLEPYTYARGTEDKYRQISSFSPQPYILNALANKLNEFPKFVKLKSISVVDPEGSGWVAVFDAQASTNYDAAVVSYKFFFDSFNQVLPSIVEKKNEKGDVIISIKSSQYVNIGEMEFPKRIEITRFLDGQIDSTTTVDVQKIHIGDTTIKPIEPDPAMATSVQDLINKIFLKSNELK